MSRQSRGRGVIALYPRVWRERYGEELADLVDSMARTRSRRNRIGLHLDLARGALDAHLETRRHSMNRLLKDSAVRCGGRYGILMGVAVAAVLTFTNVIRPAGPDESDDDPEYLIQILAAYLVIAALFVLIGAAARRRVERADSNRTDSTGRSDLFEARWVGAMAGATAGVVLALAIAITVLVIDNAFFSIISQQHDKRVAFAASGWSSMRAFINFQILRGVFVVPAMIGSLGAVLGGLGGLLARPRTSRAATA